jgi:signal peptide peptidase SppA
MPLSAAQILELRSTIFDVPLMLADNALRNLQATYELIVAGEVPVDLRARFRGDREDDSPNKTTMAGNVAVIPLVGMLAPTMSWSMELFGGTSTEEFLKQVKAAMGDPNVKGILIYADSSGGSAIGNDEVASALRSMRDQKPMAAYVKGWCASACYYLASAVGKIYATQSSVIGSVGVKMVHTEVSKMRTEMGATDTVITNDSSPLKGAGDRFQPLDKSHKDMFQRFVNASADQFESAISANRGVSVATVQKNYGGGEMFFAAEALQNGMIDAVVPDMAAAIELLLPGQKTTAAVFQAGAKSLFKEGSLVNPKLKALLFSQGLIAAVDAADDICQMAVNAFFMGTGKPAPTDEKLIMAALVTPSLVAAGVAPNVADAHRKEMEEARKAPKMTALEANDFRKELVASAKILNKRGAEITEEMISQAVDTAIKDGGDHAAVTSQWVKKLDGKEEPATRIESLGNNADAFPVHAVEGYFIGMMCKSEGNRHFGRELKAKAKPEVLQFAAAPMEHLARQCLAMQGKKIPAYALKEDIVALAMESPNSNRSVVPTQLDIRADSAGAFGGLSTNNPGDFPNLLSNLVGKLLDRSIELIKPNYEEWTGTWANDLPDFKPAPIIARSSPNFISTILNAEALKELQLGEELLGFMFLERYGNKIGLTPVLVANDDLGAFMEDSLMLQEAWERTINYKCLHILADNAALLDTYNLFDNTNHGNDILSGVGGVPGQASANAMDLKFMAQKGVGGVGRIEARFEVALIPPAYQQAAWQAWAPLGSGQLPENKLAQTDANLNTYRGRIKPVVEPALQDFSNTYWYGFSDPVRRPAIRRAYFRGWGRNGRRERYYDPATKTIWVDLEGRVGVAPTNYRYAVRNFGS